MSVHIQESRYVYEMSVHTQESVRIQSLSTSKSVRRFVSITLLCSRAYRLRSLSPDTTSSPGTLERKNTDLMLAKHPAQPSPPTMQNPPQRPLRTRASTRSRAANCTRPSPTTPPTYLTPRNQRPPQLPTPLPPSAPATSTDTTPHPATRLEEKPKAGTGERNAHGHA